MSMMENHAGQTPVSFAERFKASVGLAVAALAVSGVATGLLGLHPNDLWLYGSAVAGAVVGFIGAGVLAKSPKG